MTARKVLVTAGNTFVPIDSVRGLSNRFEGSTGGAIAEHFSDQGCDVTILTNHRYLLIPFPPPSTEVRLLNSRPGLAIIKTRTYDELSETMERLVREGGFETIIHSSAVSDYRVDGTFRRVSDTVSSDGKHTMTMEEINRTGKIGSDHDELWMRLTPTEKIVDKIRAEWGFDGTLVKFKLQVGISDEELIAIATRSMHHSRADFIVANTYETIRDKAFIISARDNAASFTTRNDLPANLYKAVFP
jgi:phosphopantothenate---cysteine ligase (CTP)